MKNFVPVVVVVTATKAKITGEVADNFLDNSDWADLTVAYAKDTTNPHGGKSAQKIAVGAITSGQVQFNHEFTIPQGNKVKVVAWLRADAPLTENQMEIGFRAKEIPEKWHANSSIAVGTDWKRYEITGTTADSDANYFILTVRKPNVTVHVDDVTITQLP